MPKEKKQKPLCVETLRHAEYYDMQETYDELYARSKNGEIFTDIMKIVLKRENILLAYRNIKTNDGSNTAGTDKLTIKDIGKMSADEVVDKVRKIVKGSKDWGYRPRPVRRKEIPKPNGDMRPLGIPCIWDRLIQQCIKQVIEPICEAKFSENSFGFRPNRSAEHAIQRCYCLMQLSKLHFVVEFDIKGFFDNVDHSKLIRQIWAMGIRDKWLIYIIKQILKTPIKMPDGTMNYPTKGTQQGGVISPLLANIVLNELDWWIENQWRFNPVTEKYYIGKNKNGSDNRGEGYEAMKKTRLKEMFIVRYADDFRIFCRYKDTAEKTKIAVTQWLKERLKLDISEEKTKVVNVRKRYSDFLGFKLKVHSKGERYVVQSHIADKQLSRTKTKLIEQAKQIVKPKNGRTEEYEISLYNTMVLGLQNYYRIATDISIDFNKVNRAVMTVFTNRLNTQTGTRLVKNGRELTPLERKLYGKSSQIRYVKGSNEPIYPIGYVQTRKPLAKPFKECSYTPEGRAMMHDNLRINRHLMLELMRQSINKSVEYTDNRVSLFSAQWGKCAITGRPFVCLDDIHCHHKEPISKGGTDKYSNLMLILKPVHILIHAVEMNVIQAYLGLLNLTKKQLSQVNELRIQAGNFEITA